VIHTETFGFNDGKIRKVVIDAGHGGKDSGALGKNSMEKDIALSIALKTGEYIEKYFPDVDVIYTRKTDKFIELHRRAEIANQAQADLFISIHCNANTSSQPYGTETYVMGLHKSKANLEVAQKENAAILNEENYEASYEGFEPNSAEAYILFSLFQNAFLDQSLIFASKVQKQFKERVGLRDRGVMQAGFLVLYKTTMPGVLVETGYLSNAKDEKFMKTEKGQTYIASAIYRAFKEYKKTMEKNLPTKNIVFDDRPLDQEAEENLDANTIEEDANELTPDKKENPDKVYFRVQFLTSAKEIKVSSKKLKNINEVKSYTHQGIFKYTSGNFETFKEANLHKSTIRKKGYKDAFVVAIQDDKRVPLQQAKKLSKQ
jgi:N-acetylmuramoyl-L-alanine amidase